MRDEAVVKNRKYQGGAVILLEGIREGFLEELVSETENCWKDEKEVVSIPEKEESLAWRTGICIGLELRLGQK